MAKRSQQDLPQDVKEGEVLPPPLPPENQDSEIETNPAQAVSELIATQSDVSEHAIDAAEKAEKEAAETAGEKLDKSGARFDPLEHASDASGNPVLTKGGNFAKKRGRKGGSTVGSVPKPSSAVNAKADSAPGVAHIESAVLGQTAAALTVQLGVIIGGQDFIPVSNKETGINEPLMLQTTWQQYFEATGRRDFPPGVALAVGLSAYILPRFTRPAVISRGEKVGLWFRAKWRAWRGTKTPAPVATPAKESAAEK